MAASAPASPTPGHSSPSMAAILLRQAPAFLAMLVIAAVFTIVARDSLLGAGVMVPVVLVTLILLRAMATWRGNHRTERKLAIVLLGAITMAEAMVTFLIVRNILDTSTRLSAVSPLEAQGYLRDALLVWIMNLLCFSLWLWELDGQGPTHRHLRGYQVTDLLFPQFSIAPGTVPGPPWNPRYADYLFVAFNTSTTFGPADTSMLSVRAKVLTMIQTMVSMAVLTVVVAWGLSVL